MVFFLLHINILRGMWVIKNAKERSRLVPLNPIPAFYIAPPENAARETYLVIIVDIIKFSSCCNDIVLYFFGKSFIFFNLTEEVYINSI